MTRIGFDMPEEAYHYLFENASDAIWIHNLEGDIVYANKACEKLTGYDRDELIGTNILKFLTSDKSHGTAREVRQRLLADEDIEQPYEQHIQRKDGTESIVRMSTSLLVSGGEVKGFQHIARDVTKERQLQRNMRYYVQEIIRAQEFERKRIARELHDDVSPTLLLLIQRIDAITTSNRLNLSAHMKQKMEDLRCQSVEALESLRRIAQDLRPRILDDLGLIPALEWMADSLIKNHGIEAQIEVSGQQRDLPSEVQLLLFRIAQEALNNIRRHTNASMALVTVEFGDDETLLSISDNGKGFEPPERMSDMAGSGKLGLAGMQERAQLLGGRINISSQPGKGTTVTVHVPVKARAEHLASSQKGLKSIINGMTGSQARG
ncbi:MAG: PAS domain S-box protein [Dehalococcoidales bacterium]